jgi:cation diffusion facilitator CzcD-associated flavoprotein CzcO
MAEHTDVVVIGAGPAGLAVGACLRKAGLDFIILEKDHQVASSWRRHYERLHLHTVKQLSSLPYVPFPAAYPRYVPRHLVVEYLDSYAAHFDLKPRFGDAVRSVRRNGTDWLVQGTSSSISARYVVIASGSNTEPVTPSVPGIETFRGKVIHSADYVNAKPFAGQSVLVIGMGNTGAEIALDLSDAGARTSISLRNGVHIVPRDLFGIPIQIVAMLATSVLPPKALDALFPVILDVALGNLSKHGIKRPKQGMLQQIASSARIPVLDVGTVRKFPRERSRSYREYRRSPRTTPSSMGVARANSTRSSLPPDIARTIEAFLQLTTSRRSMTGREAGKTVAQRFILWDSRIP